MVHYGASSLFVALVGAAVGGEGLPKTSKANETPASVTAANEIKSAHLANFACCSIARVCRSARAVSAARPGASCSSTQRLSITRIRPLIVVGPFRWFLTYVGPYFV